MNKIRRCAGRLRESLRLKCKKNSQLKKNSFFLPIMTSPPPPKVFGADSIPNIATKDHKSDRQGHLGLHTSAGRGSPVRIWSGVSCFS